MMKKSAAILFALVAIFCVGLSSCGKSGDDSKSEPDLECSIHVVKPDDRKALSFSAPENSFEGPEIKLNSSGSTSCGFGLEEKDGKITKAYLKLDIYCSSDYNKHFNNMTVGLNSKDGDFKLSMSANPSSLSKYKSKALGGDIKGHGYRGPLVFETVPASQKELDNPEVQKVLKEIYERRSIDTEFYVVAGGITYDK